MHPDMNVIVYHDASSTEDFDGGATHLHHDTTQGYEIYVLNSGTFSKAEDVDYQNRVTDGFFSRTPANGPNVNYEKPTGKLVFQIAKRYAPPNPKPTSNLIQTLSLRKCHDRKLCRRRTETDPRHYER